MKMLFILLLFSSVTSFSNFYRKIYSIELKSGFDFKSKYDPCDFIGNSNTLIQPEEWTDIVLVERVIMCGNNSFGEAMIEVHLYEEQMESNTFVMMSDDYSQYYIYKNNKLTLMHSHFSLDSFIKKSPTHQILSPSFRRPNPVRSACRKPEPNLEPGWRIRPRREFEPKIG